MPLIPEIPVIKIDNTLFISIMNIMIEDQSYISIQWMIEYRVIVATF